MKQNSLNNIIACIQSMSHSYSAALSNFKPGLYDSALLDMRMPKMYGHELYGEMKKIDDILKFFG